MGFETKLPPHVTPFISDPPFLPGVRTGPPVANGDQLLDPDAAASGTGPEATADATPTDQNGVNQGAGVTHPSPANQVGFPGGAIDTSGSELLSQIQYLHAETAKTYQALSPCDVASLKHSEALFKQAAFA